ncbi:DUF4041 domain-containing protein [Ruminococcus sp.]|uniref:DUF4041 domain-containing protein n=1 Tax=Ruminococcus sp. TaxID=41978 RepID=UPI0025E44473|nr:DUF4041 domain-containing protein [Ruminococcus sp.]MBQ8967392.1 DUF4041 domain-containing protein [Ruminococcus sp.]
MALFGPSKREQELQMEVDRLRAMLSPQQQNIYNAAEQLRALNAQIGTGQQQLAGQQQQAQAMAAQIAQLSREISARQAQIVGLDEELDLQSYSMYRPTYVFANSDLYKDRLKACRDAQKTLIKNGQACFGDMSWTVNGNAAQGRKMVKDMQKLLLRAFNVECDEIVDHVSVANFPKSKERISKTADQITKLGAIMKVAITPQYVNLKMDELCLALDFQQKKAEEKERLRELKEQQREEAKAQKEIEEARKKLEKEQSHYRNALETLQGQLARDPQNADLIAKKNELERQLGETERAIADVDYRQANIRAGYVYVISNIGAFGRDVYKIGMTRRLEPLDRIDELSGASVPFKFDVHALIFTEDAPGLEAALHNAFEDKKVNRINGRREFFHVSLDEIKRVVRQNFDKTVEWTDVPEAEQYRQSLLMNGVTEIPDIDRSIEPAPAPRQNTPPQTPTAPQNARPTQAAVTPLDTAAQIERTASEAMAGLRTQREDTPDRLRIHLYTPDNRKLGIVNISKADGRIIYRKMSGGAPQNIEVRSAGEIGRLL